MKNGINQLSESSARVLAAMENLKGILPQSMLFQVYKAFVESHFRNAEVVWGSLSNTKIRFLQRLQNRAFEIIEA